jgi:penicillin-binding protein 1A
VGSQHPHKQDPGSISTDGNARGDRPYLRRHAVKHHAINTLLALAILLLASVIVSVAYVARIAPHTPDTDALLHARDAQPSVLLSAGGTHLATYSRGRQQRVALDRISPHVIKALIATEDHRFHEHAGIDIRRTLSAVWHTLRGDAQGGSTITQQLARNMFPERVGRARTIERKLREMITALKIEKVYSKEQILETYLNSVPFLYDAVGIEMAARTYYGKPAFELDAAESAMLIGMLKGTSYYNPVLNPERAQARRNVVLSQMVKHGALSPAEYESLRTQPLHATLHWQPDPLGVAPHFAAYARRQLLEWAEANDYDLYTDGLVIYSSIDDKLQKAAADAVEQQAQVLQNIADVEWGRSTTEIASQSPGDYAKLRKKVQPFSHFWNERADLLDTFIRETAAYRKAISSGQPDQAALAKLKADSAFINRLRTLKTRLEAGFVAVDPASGQVKAWVGSRDFDIDQFDHVAQAARQPGSTFKPIVYGAAMEQGFLPDRIYPDGKVEIRTVDGDIWRPTDMGGYSGRMMTMREGLVFSKNTITAQVMQDVGVPHVVNLARSVGINQSKLYPVPSLSLGTSPVTLLEMVSAYSTIAQAGEYRKPLSITRINDRDGNLLADFDAEATRAISEHTALQLIDMMRSVITEGTGAEFHQRFNIVADIAGKTGTTQYNTDGWFILMHPNLVTGAWVGFNDSRVTMRSDYWGQGGHNAILLVGDFFRDVLKAGLIETKARFPSPSKKAPLMVRAPAEEPESQIADNADGVPSGYGVVTQPDSTTAIVVGPNGMQTVRRRDRAPPPDELGRFLTGLGLDTTVDTAVQSSGMSGNVGSSHTAGDAIAFPGVPQ